MKRMIGLAAFAALCGCNAGPGDDPAGLAGTWVGEITCYKMAAPLHMTISAVSPSKAELSRGDQATLTWKAAVVLDKGVVTITSEGPNDGAEVLSGKLAGKELSGTMEKQLCTDFKLTKQP